jgi:hypothetical protein
VTARRRAGAAAEPRRLGPYTTCTPPEASDPRQRRVGDGLVSASAGHDRDHTSLRGPRQIDAAKPRTGSRPAAEYADQRGQSKETRGNSGPLGVSTGSAHKEASLHSAQAPLKTQPQGLLPRRNRASRRPPDERYLRTRSPAQARPRPSHRRPGDRAAPGTRSESRRWALPATSRRPDLREPVVSRALLGQPFGRGCGEERDGCPDRWGTCSGGHAQLWSRADRAARFVPKDNGVGVGHEAFYSPGRCAGAGAATLRVASHPLSGRSRCGSSVGLPLAPIAMLKGRRSRLRS